MSSARTSFILGDIRPVDARHREEHVNPKDFGRLHPAPSRSKEIEETPGTPSQQPATHIHCTTVHSPLSTEAKDSLRKTRVYPTMSVDLTSADCDAAARQVSHFRAFSGVNVAALRGRARETSRTWFKIHGRGIARANRVDPRVEILAALLNFVSSRTFTERGSVTMTRAVCFECDSIGSRGRLGGDKHRDAHSRYRRKQRPRTWRAAKRKKFYDGTE